MQYLLVEYCDPLDQHDSLTLKYKLRNHSVVKKWIPLVLIANKKYQIDDPGRFYGFDSIDTQIKNALNDINHCVNIINSFKPIIDRKLSDIKDQDTLNYLHHIFEIYHGFLQDQNHKFWSQAPDDVKVALGELNRQIHRCEWINHSSIVEKIQHVVTWYGMPKVAKITDQEYTLMENGSNIGTVYLNYTEIGKPLSDMAYDNDRHMGDDAFRPFRHLTADFTIKFYEETNDQIKQKLDIVKSYYEERKDFFMTNGYHWEHPHLTTGYIPLADLEDIPINLIELLKTKQWVKEVTLL